MLPLRLGVSLQPRWPLDDGTAVLVLPIAAEHMEQAMEWIAAEVMPQLTQVTH
jgi:hypothetical protein